MLTGHVERKNTRESMCHLADELVRMAAETGLGRLGNKLKSLKGIRCYG